MDGNPFRPDNAQFWTLSDIVLKNDAAAGEKGEKGFLEVVRSTGARVDNLRYMSAQRTQRMVDHFLRGRPKEVRDLVFQNGQAAWIDGFVTGAEFGRRQAAKDLEERKD